MVDKLDPLTDIPGVGPVVEFWQWAFSDILGNTTRGVFAEYLVGHALGAKTLDSARIEWDTFDLSYQRGEHTYAIEVKSSAYVQSWHQSSEKRSNIYFNIGKRLAWDTEANTYAGVSMRHADCYVFCVFPRKRNDPTRNILDISKWGFYAITTEQIEALLAAENALDRDRVGRSWVKKNCGPLLTFEELKPSVDALLATITPRLRGLPGDKI